MKRPGPVALANAEVSIITACRIIGMRIDADYVDSRSAKLLCPFTDVYHSSTDKSFRVYTDTNSAWCFSCKSYFSPVSLVAAAWDIPRTDAAAELLERSGYTPPSMAARWAEAVDAYEPPDALMLTEALKTYCLRTHPDWETRQYHPHIAATFSACLGLLARVRGDADADLWLTSCKSIMNRAVDEATT